MADHIKAREFVVVLVNAFSSLEIHIVFTFMIDEFESFCYIRGRPIVVVLLPLNAVMP